MAGIGFVLRDLVRRDDLMSVLRGYTHATLVTCGPWLFTVATLAGLTVLGPHVTDQGHGLIFRLILIYNFAFSLVVTAPFLLVANRVLADAIFQKNVEIACTMLVTLLSACWLISAALAGPFYLTSKQLGFQLGLAALVNFLLLGGVWATSLFLTALKDVATVTRTFVLGMITAFTGALMLAAPFGAEGLVWGFNSGLAMMLFSLVARILAEYPFRLQSPRALWGSLRRYWELALAGLVYGMGIWADKWVMWFAPERHRTLDRFIYYPDYDDAMFLAFLTTIPAFALFTVMTETSFFERYMTFNRAVNAHATLRRIEENQRSVATALWEGFRNLGVLQGTISALAVFLAAQIIDLLGDRSLQIGMFRIGVLGAMFHVLFLLCTIVLAYFDLRRVTLLLHLLFFVANGSLTLLTLRLGFPFYGYGYFLAALLAFVASSLVVAYTIQRLPYITFVRRNAPLR